MKCPGCDGELSEIQAGKAKVDLCRNGCGGVWFDHRELKYFDEPNEIGAEEILAAKQKAGRSRKAPPLSCPHCQDQVLVRQAFDPKNQVEVDVCWECGGVWLDVGELVTVRAQFRTEAERQEAGDAFAADVIRQCSDSIARATQAGILKQDQEYRNRHTALISSFKSLFRGRF